MFLYRSTGIDGIALAMRSLYRFSPGRWQTLVVLLDQHDICPLSLFLGPPGSGTVPAWLTRTRVMATQASFRRRSSFSPCGPAMTSPMFATWRLKPCYRVGCSFNLTLAGQSSRIKKPPWRAMRRWPFWLIAVSLERACWVKAMTFVAQTSIGLVGFHQDEKLAPVFTRAKLDHPLAVPPDIGCGT